MDLALDGKQIYLSNSIVRRSLDALNVLPRYLSDELVNDGRATQSFQFGTLELTDDDSLLNIANGNFGEIQVTISSVGTFIKIPVLDSTNLSGRERNDQFVAHERSKKGSAHCVKFGDQKPIARPTHMIKSVGVAKLCTFVFNYRPMDILMANGIAPPKTTKASSASNSRPGSSSSAAGGRGKASGSKRKSDEVKSEEDGLEDDEFDNEIHRLEDLRQSKAARGAGPPLKRVKKEHRSTLRSGEVIDLTAVKEEPTRNFIPGEVIDLTI
ncbi:hypothetical protein MD484_g5211, partial [Candolleomyces efflorescens]